MKMIINGEKRDARNGRTIEIINPATQEFIDTVPDATQEDLQEAIDIARKGAEIWGSTPLHERTGVLMEFAKVLQDHKDELANTLCKEMGRVLGRCKVDVESASAAFKLYSEMANHVCGKTFPHSEKGYDNDLVFTVREPLGVVACIVPYNQPIKLYAFKVAAALATGNAAVVKAPSDNPMAVIRITELLIQCGVPKEALQIVTGRGAAIGDYLVSNRGIDAITFTGSTETGVHIAEICARHLQRLLLELGGNDAFIVLDDADVDLAVEEAFWGRIRNTGQICDAPKRFIVHNSVRQEFTEKLTRKLQAVKIGDPFEADTLLSCMINEKQAKKVKSQIEHTIKQGAKCLYGNERFKSTYLLPTVLTDVTADMDIAKDMEVFGPVFPIIAFDTIDEAIRIANNTIYGLSGGVISRDIKKAMKIASKIKSGEVIINGSGFYRPLEMPFGGYKMSGVGREGVSVTIEELTQEKTIALKGVFQ